MLKLSCHCGQISVETARRHGFVNACNCSLCRKSGAWWGYFDPAEVTVTGLLAGYCRGDKAEPAAEVRFCPRCGVTTHYVMTEAAIARHGNTMMGVNMALADERDLAGLELRYPDGQAWQGEGPFGYVREPVTIAGRS